jgi:hypothetical protein
MAEPITNQPSLYANGLKVTWVSGTQLSIAAGQCRDSSNIYDINLGNFLGANSQIASSVSTTVSTAALGANGVDKLPLSASQWYAVYVIADPTGYNPPAVILSLNFVAPIAPYGYGLSRRIGAVKLDGASLMLKSYSLMNGSNKIVLWDSTINVLGGTGSTTYLALSLASGIPPSSTLAILNWRMVPNVAGDNAKIRVNGSTATNNVILFGSVAAVANSGEIVAATDATQQIQYITTSALDGLTLDVAGYYDNL